MAKLGTDPTIDVMISDGLRQLFRGSARASRSTSIRHETVLPASEPPMDKDVHVWHTVSLRQDGKRPIRFKGAVVAAFSCAADTPLGQVQQTLRILTDKAGTLYCSLFAAPPSDAPARPVYRCARIDKQSDFAGFIADYRPGQCFDVNPYCSGKSTTMRDEAGGIMHSAFATMLQGQLQHSNQ